MSINALTYQEWSRLLLVERLSISAIARRHGVSRQRAHQVKSDMERKGGPFRPPPLLDVFTLKTHLESGWSVRAIARHHDLTVYAVTTLIASYQLAFHEGRLPFLLTVRTGETRLPREQFHMWYVVERRSLKEMATLSGLSLSTLGRLRNRYKLSRPRKKHP